MNGYLTTAGAADTAGTIQKTRMLQRAHPKALRSQTLCFVIAVHAVIAVVSFQLQVSGLSA